MQVLDTLDTPFVWFWHQVLRVLYTVTGRSNYFFARLTLVAGFILYQILLAVGFLSRPDFWTFLGTLILSSILTFVYAGVFWLYGQSEHELIHHHHHVFSPVNQQIWMAVGGFRIWVMVEVITKTVSFGSPIAAVIDLGPWLFLAASLYFVTDE